MAALKVFVSYAHEDEAHRRTLGKHLSALERQGLIQLWHDRKIGAGGEWRGAIDAALEDADIVLLLISPDFLASDYCHDVELAQAIRQHDDPARRTRIVPVILRSCDWQHSAFARFNALPPDGEAIVEAAHPDQRHTAVAQGLRALAEELAGEVEKPVPGTSALPPEKCRFRINRLNLGVVKPGPYDIRLPMRKGRCLAGLLAGLAGLALLLIAGVYLWLRGPLEEAQSHLRIARYDLAQEALQAVPERLSFWPGVALLREKAALGRRFQANPDDEAAVVTLNRLRRAHPRDADLLVLEGWLQYRQGMVNEARASAETATQADPSLAEAWFLLGLVQDDAGDKAKAESAYQQAADLAPDTSPHYRDNLARLYLERGAHGEAVAEYRKINAYPLARLEQALAHWARGELPAAGSAQGDALRMLGNAKVMADYNNRREWRFFPLIQEDGIRLNHGDDKRCYATLAQAASRALSGQPFAADACVAHAPEIAALIADDLCRFLDPHQPALADKAAEIRRVLGQMAICPAGN